MSNLIKNVLFGATILFLMFAMCQVKAERSPWSEDYYNRIWCEQKGGVAEYRLNDGKRVDCLLKGYAVEADLSNHKSYEAIGQSLYYAKETNKKPGILLIVKDKKGLKWVGLVRDTMRHYNIPHKLWFIIAKERIDELYSLDLDKGQNIQFMR